MSDGDLASTELDVVKALASSIKVTATQVDDIVSIYKTELAVKETRLQITYPGGAPF